MITILIIFGTICLIIVMSRKDKHDKVEDEASIAQLPSFTVQAKPMSTMSKIVNFSLTNTRLKSFSYSNNVVTITTEDGKCIKSPLCDLSVRFEKVNGLLCYTIKADGSKMSFYHTTNISGKEWDAINSTLCLAGTTWGRDNFSKATKYVGYVNMAIKAIKSLS